MLKSKNIFFSENDFLSAVMNDHSRKRRGRSLCFSDWSRQLLSQWAGGAGVHVAVTSGQLIS